MWARVVIAALFVTLTVTPSSYQSLLPVMIKQGIYEHLCPGGVEPDADPYMCHDQQHAFSFMINLSIAGLNFACLGVGLVLHKWGPRVSVYIGCILIIAGCVLFAFVSYLVGFALLGIGRPFIVLAQFSLTNLFPARVRGRVLVIVIAAMDASAIVMTLWAAVARALDVSIGTVMVAYTAVPALFICTASGIIPPQESNPPTISDALRAIRTPLFWALTAWVSCYLASKYFYLTTMSSYLAWLMGPTFSDTLPVLALSIMLPCAFVYAPVGSWLMDKQGPETTLKTMAIISGLLTVTLLVPHVVSVYLSMALVVFNRFMFFGAAPFVFLHSYGSIGSNTLYGVSLFVGAGVTMTNFAWEEVAMHNGYMIPIVVLNGVSAAAGVLLVHLLPDRPLSLPIHLLN